jgi:hypothetical protein
MNQMSNQPRYSSSAGRTIPSGGTVPTRSYGSQSAPIILEWKCPKCQNYEQELVG